MDRHSSADWHQVAHHADKPHLKEQESARWTRCWVGWSSGSGVRRFCTRSSVIYQLPHPLKVSLQVKVILTPSLTTENLESWVYTHNIAGAQYKETFNILFMMVSDVSDKQLLWEGFYKNYMATTHCQFEQILNKRYINRPANKTLQYIVYHPAEGKYRLLQTPCKPDMNCCHCLYNRTYRRWLHRHRYTRSTEYFHRMADRRRSNICPCEGQ